MNEITFTGSCKPLNDRAIRNFEAWLEASLPDKYRRFLLRTNGGHPHKHLLPECYLEAFNGITSSNSRASLQSDIEMMEDDLPPGLISIGFTGIGDRVCLSLANEKIYLWEHERCYGSNVAGLEELVPLADDIDELLSKLQGDDPPMPDEEMENIGRWADIDLLSEYLGRGRDINEISPSGCYLVRSAVYGGHLEFVKECVRRGAVLKNRALLHAAVFTMDIDMVRYLLEQGLDPNERDERGMTPLDKLLPPGTGPAAQLVKSKGGVKTGAALFK